MSRSLRLKVLQKDYHDERVPVMEHCSGLSRKAIVTFTGIDPLRERHRINEAFRRIAEVFEIDLLWGGGLPSGDEETFDWDDGQQVKRNRRGQEVVQWGIFSSVHHEDGRHLSGVPKPASVDEALEFQPQQYFLKTVDEYRAEFERNYRAMLQSTAETAVPVPHHYTTAFHWALGVFGFELLCEAGMEEDRFARLMERFAEISIRITTAWSQVEGVPAFILHDDLTMSSGPIFPPDWYRRNIFVHYPAIFAPLRSRGISINFTSDGDCSMFVDDVFNAGAEGLNFEYLVDLADLIERWPDKILIGNINSATIASGPAEAIEAEVTRCMEIGSRAPRFVVNVGGGLTHDMPVENLELYLNGRKLLANRDAFSFKRPEGAP